jgi:hypothetical protein
MRRPLCKSGEKARGSLRVHRKRRPPSSESPLPPQTCSTKEDLEKLSKLGWAGDVICPDPQSSACTGKSRPVLKFAMAISASAMDAAKNLPLFFHPMPDDPASTMRTLRRERLNGAFEAVENMAFVPDGYFEGLVIVISADFTGRHLLSFRFTSRSLAGASLDARLNEATGAKVDGSSQYPVSP